MTKLASGLVVGLVLFLGFYVFCVHYTDQYHVAIVRNSWTGELHLDTHGGFHPTAPWVRVARIDTRPIRVCVTSAGRGVNCKLVEFVPAEYQKFVKVQGFGYYWWANRISFNFGYSDEYRGMKDLLRGYAFSAERYPFVKILDGYQEPDP